VVCDGVRTALRAISKVRTRHDPVLLREVLIATSMPSALVVLATLRLRNHDGVFGRSLILRVVHDDLRLLPVIWREV